MGFLAARLNGRVKDYASLPLVGALGFFVFGSAVLVGVELVAGESFATSWPEWSVLGAGALATFVLLRRLSERSRHAEAANLRYEAIVDAAVDAIVMINTRGVIQSVNPAAEKLFGYAADEMMGRNVNMLVPEPDHHLHDHYIARYLGGGPPRILGIGREVTAVAKDGSQRAIDLAVSEHTIEGTHVFIGMMRDISERKRLERELQQTRKMDAIGQLTGGVAHDFNNLLAVILGNLEMVEMQINGEPKLQELVTEAQEAAQLGADLTNRLLAFSRRQPLVPRELDINALVSSLLDLLRRTLGETIQISTELDEALWRTRADPSQIEAAILNLAINARDAMPDGGKLTIETCNTELDESYTAAHADVTPGQYVMLSVSDSGCGMDAEVRDRAFEPFFTTKEASTGTGLGLSTIYGFAKQSGGHLSLYSEPGIGTTVNLYLPRIDAEEAAERPAAAADSRPRGVESILVVEDDPRVRRVTVRRLEMLGYEIREAQNGQDALAILAVARPDLLFTDVIMPGGLTGRELAARASEIHPGLKVLYTSGYPQSMIDDRGVIERGIVLLRKPHSLEQLAWAVRNALDSP